MLGLPKQRISRSIQSIASEIGVAEGEVTAKATAKLASTTTPSGSAAAGSGTAPLPFSLTLPIAGRVAAGRPIEAISQQRSIDVPATLIPARFQDQVTALQVVGDSMIEAAICNGDYVVVRKEQTADNGQIVAALLDGEATVKTLQRRNGTVWLMPHNAAYDPIDGTNAQIIGVVTAVLRRV